MEAKRLAILYSHLRPLPSGLGPTPLPPSSLSSSASSSSSSPSSVNHERSLRHSPTSNLQDDCVFCRIIRGESIAFKLYEDDSCLCILDTRPLSPGHSLIIPKSHFPSLEETPPSMIAAMCSKVPLISSAIMKATGSDSFNLLVNNGASAGQVIFHTHIHIIPRKSRDCLWASESLRRHSLNLNEEASQLADCIRQKLRLEDCENAEDNSKEEDGPTAASSSSQ